MYKFFYVLQGIQKQFNINKKKDTKSTYRQKTERSIQTHLKKQRTNIRNRSEGYHPWKAMVSQQLQAREKGTIRQKK